MAEQSNAAVPSGETLVDIYRRMIRIERNDDAIRRTMRLGRLTMPYYSARGQEVIPSALSAFGQLNGPVRRLGAPSCPVPFSNPLEDAFVTAPEMIVGAAKGLMG